MKTKKIYVVMGRCGEYEDYREWSVAAYPDIKMAEAHVTAASNRALELMVVRHHPQIQLMSQYDPNIDMSWTGTDYFVVEVTLLKKFKIKKVLKVVVE